jgi:hypothetical protein
MLTLLRTIGSSSLSHLLPADFVAGGARLQRRVPLLFAVSKRTHYPFPGEDTAFRRSGARSGPTNFTFLQQRAKVMRWKILVVVVDMPLPACAPSIAFTRAISLIPPQARHGPLRAFTARVWRIDYRCEDKRRVGDL